MEKRKIDFVGTGKRQPFNEFLKEEKEAMGISWTNFNEMLGASRTNKYAHKSEATTPGNEIFYRMIETLGYNDEDFLIDGLNPGGIVEKRNTTLYEVAETAIEAGRTNLSTTFIRNCCGGSLYEETRNREQMDGLINEINGLSPSYNFTYIPQFHKKTANVSLAKVEEDFICDVLLGHDIDGKRMPNGIYQEIQKGLEELGFKRSIESLYCKVPNIWNNDVKKGDSKIERTPSGERDLTEYATIKTRTKKLWEKTVSSHNVPLDDFWEQFRDKIGEEPKSNNALHLRAFNLLERKLIG